MGYEISLNLAWDELERLDAPSKCTVTLLRDNYEVKVGERAVLLESSGAPAEADGVRSHSPLPDRLLEAWLSSHGQVDILQRD